MRRLQLRRVRLLLIVFVAGLVVSGLTALPLVTELELLCDWLGVDPARHADHDGLRGFVARVADGLRETNVRYPFLAYGTDWLAFGHLVIALMFVGPIRDPLSNRWVITAGMIACVAVVPVALIAGEARGIPFGWRLLDCSFGVVGMLPLWLSHRTLERLER